jgi:hypothetical protein
MIEVQFSSTSDFNQLYNLCILQNINISDENIKPYRVLESGL